MKTLTELSGATVRKAAAAIAAVKRSLPQEEPAAVEAPVLPVPAEVAPASVEGEGASAGEAVASSPPAPPPGRPIERAESEAVKAALDAAVAAETGLSGERLARLRDAVEVAGRQVDDVRLVRVFGPEEPVPGATSLNGFQYLVDLAPASMRQVPGTQRKERGRGGPGGGRGGGGGKGAPASGGFSMDSLKEDRKGQRRGPAGGGRTGGGKPGGGPPR